eukprot:jgi/Orpsp1_1/1177248/evm.model.c7180000060686.1
MNTTATDTISEVWSYRSNETNPLFKQEFNNLKDLMKTKNKLYCLFKLFKDFNIHKENSKGILLYRRRELFDKNYPKKDYIRNSCISQFNHYSLKRIKEKVKLLNSEVHPNKSTDPQDTSKYLMNSIRRNNVVPTLYIDYEYMDSYIKFLEAIIKEYDKHLNYKYSNVTITNHQNTRVTNLNNYVYKSFLNIKLTNKENYTIKNDSEKGDMGFFIITMALYLLNSNYTNNYIYNTVDNYNFCHYHQMTFKNDIIGRWLKWINNLYSDYETKEDDRFGSFSHSSTFKQLKRNTKMLENVLYFNLKDFYSFDDYTNINRTLLPSFFYYLNKNNIYNTYILLNRNNE